MAFAAPVRGDHGLGRRLSPIRLPGSVASVALEALANLTLAVAVIDGEQVVLANPRFEALFGGTAGAALLKTAIKLGAKGAGEIALEDGRTLRVEAVLLPLGLLITAEDISDRLAEAARALAEARIDTVTGLCNRLSFTERLAGVAGADLAAGPAAVLTISLDRLKDISEPLGHSLGEAVMKAAADRLRAAAATPVDTIARLDGDTFALLQLGQPQPRAAAVLAERLADLLGRPYFLDGHLLTVEPHLGIALMADNGGDGATALKRANVALSQARRAAPGAFRFFEAAMEREIEARRRLELDLRRALTLREFVLVYQPQVNLASGHITGFESLLRWNSPLHGLVSPATFIPLAEESGLITTIGAWGLRTACREAMRWPEPFGIAVNVSALQVVAPSFLDTIHSALAESGLDPQRLELEITESVLMHDDGTALDTLRAVRDSGVKVSMDDFGTGYSSLSRLHSFPFDKIKIDQSFVRAGPEDPSGQAIVRAIAALGGSLGIATTAEGVETKEQLDRIIADGCTEAQGYLIGRPTPPDQITELLQRPAMPLPRAG